jgi:heme-degrading monooxygenase HmoA
VIARVASFEEAPPERADEAIAGVAAAADEALAEVPGMVAYLMLVDREGGLAVGISLWEDEAAVEAGEKVFARTTGLTPEIGGQRVSLRRYEVAVARGVGR